MPRPLVLDMGQRPDAGVMPVNPAAAITEAERVAALFGYIDDLCVYVNGAWLAGADDLSEDVAGTLEEGATMAAILDQKTFRNSNVLILARHIPKVRDGQLTKHIIKCGNQTFSRSCWRAAQKLRRRRVRVSAPLCARGWRSPNAQHLPARAATHSCRRRQAALRQR